MSDLFDRLHRVTGGGPESDRDGDPGRPIEDLVSGEWRTSAAGRCFMTEASYALDHQHGAEQLRSAYQLLPALLAIAELEGEPDVHELLFLDAETTGLGRDAGTIAFLMGIGWFAKDRFIVRQYFMGEPDDELALLGHLETEIGRRGTLVSFNGITFDWPLLRNRYLYNGLVAPEPEAHLDLLHWSRSLWRHVLPSCALSSLEEHVLGVRRTGEDVPGYLIPQLYYDYLRTGDATPLASVFYHNLIDVVSMTCLAGRVAATLLAPAAQDVHLRDLVAVGRLYERRGRHEDALNTYWMAQASSDESAAAQAGERLGLLLKRLGRLETAAEVWRQHLDGPRIVPTVELAKYLEHQVGDLATAVEIVERGIARVQSGQIEHPWPQEILRQLQHRLDRLERRLSRSRDGGC